MGYYDRYMKFRNGTKVNPVPFVKIRPNDSDIYIKFEKDKMRFDSLSYKYYADPDFGWLILQANPECSPYEYLIEDGTTLRIPYPLQTAINRYENEIETYFSVNEI